MWFKRKKKERDVAQEHLQRALTLAAEGCQEEAIKAFEASIALRPDSRTTRLSLGSLLCDLGRYDDGLVHFHHLTKLDPEDAEPVFRMGEAYALAGKRDWAIAEYRQALFRDPKHELARARLSAATAEQFAFSMGELNSRREQQAWALAEFKQAKRAWKRQRSLGYRLTELFRRS